MLGLLAAWSGLLALLISLTMLLYRPAFNDVLITMTLYFCCPLSFTFSGIILWATRQHKQENANARGQAAVGMVLGLLATVIAYLLVIFAEQVPVAA